MRKKYLHDQYGADASFWDKNWIGPFPAVPQVDAKLVRSIEHHLKPGSRILEGGCGNANYLRYFHERGYAVTGVDFAEATVKRIREAFPDLDVVQGSILDLVFADNTYDAYYSGGVIEHFENGVDAALREAARVLRPGGLFFVTVPHMNVARLVSARLEREKHITDLDDREAYIKEGLQEFVVDIPPGGYHFHEYEFETGEMRRFLQQHGFRIIEETPFSTMWGIRDLQFYHLLAGIGRNRATLYQKGVRRAVRLTGQIDEGRGIAASLMSAVQSRLFGNLKLYICVAQGSQRKP